MSTDFLKPGVVNAFEGLSLQLAEDLVGIEECKPSTLVSDFPRIMEKINETWPSLAALSYIESLIISDRIDREGFPAKVLSELCFLKELRTFLYPPAFEANQRVEDLIHSPFQVQSISTLVELYGPKNAMGLAAGLPGRSQRATGWGEIDTDEGLGDALKLQRRPPSRLGEILVKFGLVSEHDRDAGLLTQQTSLKTQASRKREPLGKILVEAGKLQPIDLRKALVHQSQGLLVNLDLLTISHPALTLVPQPLAAAVGAVALQVQGQSLAVAMENPLGYRGERAIDALKKMTGLVIRPAWASADAIERKLQNYRTGRTRKDF